MLTRRKFLESIVGTAALSLIPKQLCAAPEPESQFILDSRAFERFLTISVRESLRDTRVQFIQLENYSQSLRNAASAARITLVYDGTELSGGLAALLYTIDRRCQGIEESAVCFSDSPSPSVEEANRAARIFSLTGFPGFVFYRNSNGVYVHDNEMSGGIRSYNLYQQNVDILLPYIDSLCSR